MNVPNCYICDSNPAEKQRYGTTGLAEGDYCPVCYRPYCKFHAGKVRWRWRDTREVETGYVCIECKNTYRHRQWDPLHRDWIS
jgi:hypothetical protein